MYTTQHTVMTQEDYIVELEEEEVQIEKEVNDLLATQISSSQNSLQVESRNSQYHELRTNQYDHQSGNIVDVNTLPSQLVSPLFMPSDSVSSSPLNSYVCETHSSSHEALGSCTDSSEDLCATDHDCWSTYDGYETCSS